MLKRKCPWLTPHSKTTVLDSGLENYWQFLSIFFYRILPGLNKGHGNCELKSKWINVKEKYLLSNQVIINFLHFVTMIEYKQHNLNCTSNYNNFQCFREQICYPKMFEHFAEITPRAEFKL